MLFYCVDNKLGYRFTYVVINLHDIYIYIALWWTTLMIVSVQVVNLHDIYYLPSLYMIYVYIALLLWLP